jgi:hypothetical protein
MRRNLSDSFIKEEETKYPEVNISKQHAFTASDKIVRNSNNSAGHTAEQTGSNVALTDENKEDEIHQVSDMNEQTIEHDVDDDSEKIVGEVTVRDKEPSDNEEAFISASSDLHVSTGIPDNFESLYKTAISCDDSDNVKFLMSEDSVKNEDKTKKDDDIESEDTSVDTGLGLNVNRGKTGANVRLEIDRGVGDDNDDDDDKEVDVVDDESVETEEASVSRDNLSLNFDEDNAELLKLEKGLIAVCVGKTCTMLLQFLLTS